MDCLEEYGRWLRDFHLLSHCCRFHCHCRCRSLGLQEGFLNWPYVSDHLNRHYLNHDLNHYLNRRRLNRRCLNHCHVKLCKKHK